MGKLPGVVVLLKPGVVMKLCHFSEYKVSGSEWWEGGRSTAICKMPCTNLGLHGLYFVDLA